VAEFYDRAIAAAANLPIIDASEVARIQEALGDAC